MNQLYRCILLCLLLVGTLFAGVSLAQAQNPSPQEQEEENTAPATGEPNAEQEQTKEEETPAAKRKSADTFVPSEGISEDLSVSFPVDI